MRPEAASEGLDCFVASAPRKDGRGARSSPHPWSAILGRHIPDTSRMRSDIVQAIGQMDALFRRRALLDRQSRPPFVRRPDRPWDETAAAVRAHVVEFALDAIGTECALVRAD